ncbi:MAG: response regulator [Bacteroidales bacterium]
MYSSSLHDTGAAPAENLISHSSLQLITLEPLWFFGLLFFLVLAGIAIAFLIWLSREERRKLTAKIVLLEKKAADLEQANQQSAVNKTFKTDFLAGISHEIRTPMNAVLGFTDILLGQAVEEQQEKYLNAIRSATKNLLRLIDDILDLSKIENKSLRVVFEPANPRMIFDDIENTFSKQAAEKQLGFEMLIDERLPKVLLLDEIRVRQILFNLVGNAIRFSNSGSVRMVVKVLEERKTAPEIDISVDIHDSGPGIPPEQQKAIMDAFDSDSGHTAAVNGTGLGLFISKKLAALMNGNISFVSISGKGTTFSLILKAVKALKTETPVSGRRDINIKDVKFRNSTVLIADDVIHNRFLIKEFLKNANLQTYEASNGKEALDQAKLHNPEIILMDIRMPSMDGIEATRLIREEPGLKDVRVVALTASVMEEEIKKIANAGFDDFLKKPVKLSSLIRMLIKYLPHEIVKKKPENQGNGEPAIVQAQSFEANEELISLLRSDIFPVWEQVNQSGFIDEITKFGIELQDIGNEHNCERLASYGKSLVDSSESFDVSSMKKILNQFPHFIEQLKVTK